MPAVVIYALVLWTLAGKKQGDGYGFPFDRPYLSFYGRLKALHTMLTKLNAVRLSGKKKNNMPYLSILGGLIDTPDDATLRKSAGQMAQKASVFGYAFARFRVPEKDFLFGIVLVLLMIPPVSVLIAEYAFFAKLRLVCIYNIWLLWGR